MAVLDQVKEIVKNAVIACGISCDNDLLLDFPVDLSFGDVTTNVAMVYAKTYNKNPKELADEIVDTINKLDSHLRGNGEPLIKSASVAGPGFINIKLTPKALLDARSWATQDELYNSNINEGKNILVEHSSPNLFKPFHIGHLMNNTVGESITRLMRTSGAMVATTSFPSDISLGIAKAVYALCYDEDILNKKNILPPETVAGLAYVKGTALYDLSDEYKESIKKVSKTLYSLLDYNFRTKQEKIDWVNPVDVNDEELQIFNEYKKYRDATLLYLVKMLKDISDSSFDEMIFESEAGVRGFDIVSKNISFDINKKGVFQVSQDAYVYIPEESRKDINTAVFINSQGHPTYEAKDIGLIDLKFEEGRFFEQTFPDLSIFITDNEQIPHFKVVLAAYQDIEDEMKSNGEEIKEAAKKSVHVSHGRMSFKGAKMSSRLGNTPTAEEILSVVYEEALQKMKDSGREDINEKTAHDIALGAVKFAILRSKPGSNINFDPETSLSFEGDSGPYLMYTHARICSLLEKAINEGVVVDPHLRGNDEIPADWKSLPIESILLQFPTVVERAQKEYAPQHVVSYLLTLAQEFNSWYGNTKMIDTDEQASYRIAICSDVKKILHDGLYMLGINAPVKM